MLFQRLISFWVVISFSLTTLAPYPQAHADTTLGLPAPGAMVNLSPAYEPVIIKGLTVHKDNPFLFDFIVDVGQDKMSGEPLKKEGEKLIKYFLASLAIPDKDLWVNLSPYEKNKMIPEALGQTDMGRDLLEQDYILKQITASLIYPEKQLGKTFWDKVYAKAQELYGTTQVPVNTFNKVWIMADRAEVFEHNQTAFVVGCHLKVMLEEDYLALQKHSSPPQVGGVRGGGNDPHAIASQIVREVILPELEKEVNTGKNFANLRQIFNSIILSSWYKKNLKEALLNQVYADKSKVKGINLNDPTVKEQIYQQYLKAYKKGVFNYIKEESFPPLDGDRLSSQPHGVKGTGPLGGVTIPRKYFSGGLSIANTPAADPAMTSDERALAKALPPDGRLIDFATLTSTRHMTPSTKPTDAAMVDQFDKLAKIFGWKDKHVANVISINVNVEKLVSELKAAFNIVGRDGDIVEILLNLGVIHGAGYSLASYEADNSIVKRETWGQIIEKFRQKAGPSKAGLINDKNLQEAILKSLDLDRLIEELSIELGIKERWGGSAYIAALKKFPAVAREKKISEARSLYRQRVIHILMENNVFPALNPTLKAKLADAAMTNEETIQGLIAKKDQVFKELLEKQGVETYQSTIDLARVLHEQGYKIAVASSSRSARKLLERIGILNYFNLIIDGNDIRTLNLKGKPHSDIYDTVTKQLAISPSRSIVIEDTALGIQSGRAAGYVVIGLARENNKEELSQAGADIVFEDLSETSFEGIKSFLKEIKGESLEGVIFDFDGVIAANIENFNFNSWKHVLDAYLQQRARELKEPFIPFTEREFKQYMRIAIARGLKDFLESRGIHLPDAAMMEEFGGKLLLDETTGRIRFGSHEPIVKLGFNLWFIRHGETDSNKSENFQGMADDAINQLNSNGKAQAKEAAENLFTQIESKIRSGEEIVLLTSQLRRSQETAQAFIDLVKQRTGIQLQAAEDKGANEINFGAWENHNFKTTLAADKDEMEKYSKGISALAKASNGESFFELLKRVKAWIEDQNKKFEGKTVVLFGHGTYSSALRILLGDPTMVDETSQIDWQEPHLLTHARPVLLNELAKKERVAGLTDAAMTGESKVAQLVQLGHAVALDEAKRDTTALARYVKEHHISHVTINPNWIRDAVLKGEFDDVIKSFDETEALNDFVRFRQVVKGIDDINGTNKAIYYSIIFKLVNGIADVLKPVYDASNGREGIVSIQLSPDTYLSADDMIKEIDLYRAQTLTKAGWHSNLRENVDFKIPATPEGIAAIEKAVAGGYRVNVTNLFPDVINENGRWKAPQYEAVAEAYIRGIEQFVEYYNQFESEREKIPFYLGRLNSVFSVWLRMIDDDIDDKLPIDMRGKFAIAQAKIIFELHKKIFQTLRFKRLTKLGAQPPKILWANNRVKPTAHFPRWGIRPEQEQKELLHYIEPMIGTQQENQWCMTTMLPETIEAYARNGELKPRLTADLNEAKQTVKKITDYLSSLDKPMTPIDIRENALAASLDNFGVGFLDTMEYISRTRRSPIWLDLLSDEIIELYLGRIGYYNLENKVPVIVADGPSGIGKTSTMKTVVRRLNESGHKALYLSMDMFLTDRNKRWEAIRKLASGEMDIDDFDERSFFDVTRIQAMFEQINNFRNSSQEIFTLRIPGAYDPVEHVYENLEYTITKDTTIVFEGKYAHMKELQPIYGEHAFRLRFKKGVEEVRQQLKSREIVPHRKVMDLFMTFHDMVRNSNNYERYVNEPVKGLMVLNLSPNQDRVRATDRAGLTDAAMTNAKQSHDDRYWWNQLSLVKNMIGNGRFGEAREKIDEANIEADRAEQGIETQRTWGRLNSDLAMTAVAPKVGQHVKFMGLPGKIVAVHVYKGNVPELITVDVRFDGTEIKSNEIAVSNPQLEFDAAMTAITLTSLPQLSPRADAFVRNFNGLRRNQKAIEALASLWAKESDLTWEDLKAVLKHIGPEFNLARQGAVILLRFRESNDFVESEEVWATLDRHAKDKKRHGVEDSPYVRQDSLITLATIDLEHAIPLLNDTMHQIERQPIVQGSILDYIIKHKEKFEGDDRIVKMLRSVYEIYPSSYLREKVAIALSKIVPAELFQKMDIKVGSIITPEKVIEVLRTNGDPGNRKRIAKMLRELPDIAADDKVWKILIMHSFDKESGRGIEPVAGVRSTILKTLYLNNPQKAKNGGLLDSIDPNIERVPWVRSDVIQIIRHYVGGNLPFKEDIEVRKALEHARDHDPDSGVKKAAEETLKVFESAKVSIPGGGIDLNTSNGMQWKVTKDANGVEMNVDPAMIERVRREGIDSLSPVIFKMTPVASIWPLVGLQAPVKDGSLAGV